MRFARRAGWLQELFPPSVVPAAPSYPDRVSTDVSLTAPYDAGGWGLANPESWITPITSVVAAAGTVVVLAVPDGQLYRWMAGSVAMIAGVAPAGQFELLVPGGAVSMGASSTETPTGPHKQYDLIPPIVGPTISIRYSWAGGDAATQLAIRIYGTLLPLGASPTI